MYNNAFTDTLGEQHNHFVVLTVNASDNIKHIHDRRPVFLDEYTKELWLDPSVPFYKCFEEIMKSKAYEGLKFYEVGSIVNSIKFDNEECIMPKDKYEELLHSKGLGKYFNKIPVSSPN